MRMDRVPPLKRLRTPCPACSPQRPAAIAHRLLLTATRPGALYGLPTVSRVSGRCASVVWLWLCVFGARLRAAMLFIAGNLRPPQRGQAIEEFWKLVGEIEREHVESL